MSCHFGPTEWGQRLAQEPDCLFDLPSLRKDAKPGATVEQTPRTVRRFVVLPYTDGRAYSPESLFVPSSIIRRSKGSKERYPTSI